MTNKVVIIFIFICLFFGCSSKDNYIPKPRGYFRIEFPEKKYRLYTSECNYKFEYPEYAIITPFKGSGENKCWINIEFPQFNGKVHLTYKRVENNLPVFTEDLRTLAHKHIPKADDIIETPVIKRDKKVFGMIYDIRGNTASSYNFFLTDSTDNFLSGALYFNAIPNKDSIAPVNTFLIKDIQHLIETFEWN